MKKCQSISPERPLLTGRSSPYSITSFFQKIISALALICAVHITTAAQQEKSVQAVLNKTKLSFFLDESGRPTYAINYNEKPVVLPSALGFALGDDSTFYKNFEIIGTDKKSTDEIWQPVWGEVKNIRNHYEQVTIQLRQKVAPNRLLNIVFRVFEEGVGFRYEFPKQPSLRYFIITDEFTDFRLAGDHNSFWIPGDYDSNEYSYTNSKLSEIDNRPVVIAATDIAVRTVPDPYSVQTPLMMKTKEGLYINIHEAALTDYSAMQLNINKYSLTLRSRLVPDAAGNKCYLHAPAKTPWRTIIVSDKATDILASKMILNLNEPSVIENTSWIKPMKFVGIWWELQTARSNWNYSDYPDSTDADGKPLPNGKHGANTTNLKRYIDFAAANGIDAVLAEGWNTGWEDWFGNWKENVFDFITPYPDYDVNAITAYAKEKGVKLIMHNETSGSATNYERQVDTAFRFMNRFGYPAVKTGYVGKIIPRGEHHDGQWMINHYERILKKGIQYQVTVDAHEPPRPTGLHRTYPNFVASEAGRGNEYHAFSNGNNPDHETILPFTRLMGGPMDYTPGIFRMKGYTGYAPERQIHSTLAKQLALYVTLYSPLQMAADLPENYEAKPDAFQFIKDVAVDWDDTRILEAEPGDYISIARKAKGTDNWFIGSITDENKRQATIPLSFLDIDKTYVVTIYADAANADWKTNPEAYSISKFAANYTTTLKLELAAGGGAAISIVPATSEEIKKLKKYK